MTAITMMTISVNRIASCRDGQDTLRNSPTVSWKNLWMLCQKRWKKFIPWRADFKSGTVIPPIMVKTPPLLDGVTRKSHETIFRQARQESNPQPPLLESGALPN
jgi:hypothetical protein